MIPILQVFVSPAFAIPLATAEDVATTSPKLSAGDIVDKNVAARGGLQAWRLVQAISFAGKLGAGGNQRASVQVTLPPRKTSRQAISSARPIEEIQLPFLVQLERPRKMRLEPQFNGQTAVQVFDGAQGWKLRPFLGRNVIEPYTADELKISSMQADLDGPVVDYAAKGTKVQLEGMEKVEQHDTYKLKLTTKDG